MAVVSDLFAEQVVLVGGVVDLMRAAFETLVEHCEALAEIGFRVTPHKETSDVGIYMVAVPGHEETHAIWRLIGDVVVIPEIGHIQLAVGVDEKQGAVQIGDTVEVGALIGKDLTLRGNSVFSMASYFEALEFLRHTPVPLDEAVTHCFAIEEAVEAFATFDAGETGKVVFAWND